MAVRMWVVVCVQVYKLADHIAQYIYTLVYSSLHDELI